ncbi:MAG: hypothetical protein EOO39_11005 [Cytophagaceae bacterium]|nr:MAG: hypothetical protein EOO39_11005 [Cytophagaceae bacterium]
MNDSERIANYIKAFEQLTVLIADVDQAIQRAIEDQDRLGLKQYKHLKTAYIQQLAELISRAPQSVRVQATAV